MNKLASYFILASSLIFTSSCSPDNPAFSGTGTNFITSNTNGPVISLTTKRITSFIIDTMRTKDVLMFGKFRDAVDNVLTLKGYARFSYSFDIAKVKTPVSCELKLLSRYSPNPHTMISFDVFRSGKAVSLATIRFKSQLELSEKLNTVPFELSTSDTLTLKSYPLPFSFTQTLFDAIKKGRPYVDGDSSEVGIMLVPTKETGIVKINPVLSKLAFTYDEETETGVERKTVLMSFNRVAYTSSQTKENYNSDTTSGIYISSSIADFTNLIFDMSVIPDNSHIIKAELQLHADTLATKVWTKKRETYNLFFTTNDNTFAYSTSPTLSAYSAQDTSSSGWFIKGKYRFDVTGYAQKWTNLRSTNFGFHIRPSEHISHFSFTKFYYKNAPHDTLKPTIKIYYTQIH